MARSHSRIALRQVDFPFAALPHAALYPLRFPGPVRFEPAAAGHRFDAQFLALPAVHGDESGEVATGCRRKRATTCAAFKESVQP